MNIFTHMTRLDAFSGQASVCFLGQSTFARLLALLP